MDEVIKKELISRAQKAIGKKIYKVSDKFAKPVISLCLIQNDLLEIAACLEKAEGYLDIDDEIVSSLWKSAIVTYGKIFSSSKDGFSTLHRRDVISEQQVVLHDKLILLRNSYVAHRGENSLENSMLVVNEEKDERGISINFSVPVIFQAGHLISDISEMKDLIQDLLKIVEEKIIQKLKGIEGVMIKDLVELGKIHPVNLKW